MVPKAGEVYSARLRVLPGINDIERRRRHYYHTTGVCMIRSSIAPIEATETSLRDRLTMANHQSDKILRTCSDCTPFCASWSSDCLCPGGVKYTGGRHAHRIWDRYHQGYDSDSDSESDKKEPTLIGPGSDGCTVEQRVAFLCSLYKIAAEAGEGLFSDPKFLKKCFEDLIYDQDKTMTFMLLYSCNKIQPECYALPRKHGLADIEVMGTLEQYRHDEEMQDEEEDHDASDYESSDVPFEVLELKPDADEAQHFVLSRAQWKQLRNQEGCVGCTLYMSLLTYRNMDYVNVKDLFSIRIA